MILAAHIGGMTVSEMKQRMDYDEYLAWQWHHEIHPFGSVSDDARMLDVMTHISNIVQQIYAKKGRKPPQQEYRHYRDRMKSALSRVKKVASESVQDAWADIFGEDD